MATTTLYQQWADAFASVGECHLSLDTCCKLLAVVYVYGGANEAFTQTSDLVTDWRAAARRLNISGGETVNPEGHALLRKYIGDLEDDVKNRKSRGGLLRRGMGKPPVCRQVQHKETAPMIYDTILCDLEFNQLYRKHGQLRCRKPHK